MCEFQYFATGKQYALQVPVANGRFALSSISNLSNLPQNQENKVSKKSFQLNASQITNEIM